MAKSSRGKSATKTTKKTSSSSKKTTSKSTKTSSTSSTKKSTKSSSSKKTTTTDKKPVRKNYKTEKEYKAALKKYNEAQAKEKARKAAIATSGLTKKIYTVPNKDRTSNIIQYISGDEDSESSVQQYKHLTPAKMTTPIQATNDLATETSNSVDYSDLPGQTINSRKTEPGIPLVPTGDKKTGTESKFLDPSTGKISNTKAYYMNLNYIGSRANLSDSTELAKGVTLSDMMSDVHKAVMLPAEKGETKSKLFSKMATYYNRFKIPDYNQPLQKGFAHVFFVRPSCNILNQKRELTKGLTNHPLFNYAYNSNPDMLGELVMKYSHNTDNQFMMSLSNYVASFSLSDEYINTDTYGRTFTGYKVSYGKNDIESKTAGTIDVTFSDDGSFHVYQLIRLWVEYISGVYRGEFSPSNKKLFKKIIDYAGAIYYIITAEDGETILFWSKYYGVYPSTIPSSQYSWGEGNLINAPQLSVTFNYSFKQDFNPYTILEFNHNAKVENTKDLTTVPVYDYKLGHSSWKWGQKPFIQLVQGETDNKYKYKLRFTKIK